jgi:hypothetical protein
MVDSVRDGLQHDGIEVRLRVGSTLRRDAEEPTRRSDGDILVGDLFASRLPLSGDDVPSLN